jgi:hypothetical protein
MKQCLLFLFVSYLFDNLYFVVPCYVNNVLDRFYFHFSSVFQVYVVIVIVTVCWGAI